MATHLSSCLENPMDIGAWRATVDRTAKSWTWLRGLSMHARTRQPARPQPFLLPASHPLPVSPASFPTSTPQHHGGWENFVESKGLWGEQWRLLDCWMVYPCLAFHFKPALCNKEKCILTVVGITIKRIFSPVHLSFFFISNCIEMKLLLTLTL